MEHRFKAAILAFALAFIGLFAVASPAQAVGVCTADAICFYDTSGSWYPMVDHDRADSSPGECFGMGGNAFKTSWVWNRTAVKWYVYKGANCSGERGTIYANTSGAMDSNWNNKIVAFSLS
jgi:hypothetical protein